MKQSLGARTAALYERLRASRGAMALFALVVTVCWMLTRLDAYTELVQSKRQQTMAGFGILLSAATAPSRHFPWRGDATAAGAYEAQGDVFRDFRPFANKGFTETWPIYTEKGILFPIRILSRYFGAPASATSLVAVQLVLDLLVTYGICLLLWRWGGPVAAMPGGLYYALSKAAAAAATFPFYYYWPIAFGIVLCLAADVAARRGRLDRASTAAVFGVILAYWLLFRSTAVLIPFAIAAALLLSGTRLRRVAAMFAVIVAIELLPQALLSLGAPREDSLTLGRGNMWHALYLGIGTRPNPYGIVFSDSYAANMVESRYGISFQAPGYELALRREYLNIVRTNPGLILRNTFWNFLDAMRGWSLPKARADVGPVLGIFGVLGLVLVLVRRTDMTFPVALAMMVWVVQCLTLAIILRPQEGYLWETVGIRVLAGFAGFGLGFEWLIERLTRLRRGFAVEGKLA